jgi:hypothetical protein
LQDWATEWLYYPNSYPATRPIALVGKWNFSATTGQILTKFVSLPQRIKLELKHD